VNAAAAFAAGPGVTPESLLSDLKSLEREFGRGVVAQRNSPRELDLDLLLFDGETRSTSEFTLPHPRAVDRRFVLVPAAEVLPEELWPGTGRSIRELLAELETDEVLTRMEGNGR
jgi:2-amino-4-hydroxy-6-hydroxymethyldihydropteridine diphosphokinase